MVIITFCFSMVTLIVDLTTTTGPVVSLAAADRIRKQISDAVSGGAKLEIPEGTFPLDKPGTTFVGPQVLTNVTNNMSIPSVNS